MSRYSRALRRLQWRLGRRLYTAARGESANDPQTNGEYWLLDQVLREDVSKTILLDIGANKGDWTAAALRMGRNSHSLAIHAFEPSCATRSMLTDRFRHCAAVSIHGEAISDEPGETTLYTGHLGAGTNSLSPISGQSTEQVPVTTIDRFLSDSDVRSVSLAKIDTEGFDLLVLKGALESLQAGRISVVQFEYNWRWLVNHACLRDVFELIDGLPYQLAKFRGSALELYEQWHPELDRFFEANYVLVKSGSPLIQQASTVRFDFSNVALRQ